MFKYYYLPIILITLFSCNEHRQNEVTSFEVIKIGGPENKKDSSIHFGASIYLKVNLEDSTYFTKVQQDEFIDDTIRAPLYYSGKTTKHFQTLSEDLVKYLENINVGPIPHTHFPLNEPVIYCGGLYIIAFNKNGKEHYYSFQIRNLPTIINKWYWGMKYLRNPGGIVHGTFLNTDSITQYYAEKKEFDSVFSFKMPPLKDQIKFVAPKKRRR